jgi:hypothetical protein
MTDGTTGAWSQTCTSAADDEIRDRIAAELAVAGLADVVAAVRSPSDRGTTRWAAALTDDRHGLDVVATLARLRGVCDVRRHSPASITFDVDRAVSEAGRS